MDREKKPEGLIQDKGKYLILAYITAFSAGFCVMVVEVVAARLIARYLGASIYTWTSVIGVVLAGIALGNYIGGWIADRYQAKKALSNLFLLAAFSCVLTPVLNRLMGTWLFLMYLSWPLRVAGHVMMVFFFPAVILGMISPVVAKMALDQGLKPGRTIGNIYASGSMGSIVGTFITGFFLIAFMGTNGVIWVVAAILGIIGLFYGFKKPGSYAGIAMLTILGFISLSIQGWAVTVSQNLALREVADPAILYQAESMYSDIKILRSERHPQVRKLILGQLLHSILRMDESGNIVNLYAYQEVYEGITGLLAKDKKNISALIIGGGGYVFPRYLEEHYPGSYIEAIEIDPAVTKAAKTAFGLSPETSIKIYHGDARNRVDELIRRQEQGEAIPVFDVVYGDAFNDLSIPFQLVSYEFNEKIRQLLSPEGVYMLTLADTIESGKFLGAMVNTFKESFPYLNVFLTGDTRVKEELRNVFVLVGSFQPLDWPGKAKDNCKSVRLNQKLMQVLHERSGGIVLTDNYAPVENLLAAVVQQQGLRRASAELTSRANKLVQKSKLEKAMKQYSRVLERDPEFSQARNNLANVLASKGKINEAISYYEECLRLDPEFAEAHNNLAIILIHKGRLDEAITHYQESIRIEPETAETHYNLGVTFLTAKRLDEAAECFVEALRLKPNMAEAYSNLGNTFLNQNKVEEAVQYYQKALSIKPDIIQAHNNLGIIYTRQGKFKEAQWHYNRVLNINPEHKLAKSNLAALSAQMENYPEGESASELEH